MSELTPTQRVERESFTETNQANAIATKKFALQLATELEAVRKVADELAESVYRVGTTMCGCDNCNAYIKAQYALTTYENLPHKKTTKPTE